MMCFEVAEIVVLEFSSFYFSKKNLFCCSGVREESSRLAFVKIGGRRPCDAVASDVSSLQIYSAHSLQTDLVKNVQALKRVAERYAQ